MPKAALKVSLFFLLIASPSYTVPVSEPLAVAAEYYFNRHDYRQASKLWTEVYQRSPENSAAMLRVAELQLFFDGRAASRDTILKFLERVGPRLDSTTRKEIQTRLGELQSSFLNDETQSIFLQATTKARFKDWTTALTLFTQALNLEKGNFAVLKEKAHCEKALAQYDKFYATLKLALEGDPFDSDMLENFIEAQYYFKDYKDSIALFQKQAEALGSLRAKTAYGLALVEMGLQTEATSVLSSVLGQSKTSLHPIVWFAMGKILSKQPTTVMVGTQYLDRFIIALGRPDSLVVDGWDPFRSAEKMEEAKSILATVREGKRIGDES